jgi:type IV pilus assembly protein PilE
VIAVLIAIGIPGYQHHVLRAKRVDASRELLMLAQRLQECHDRTESFARMDDVPNACVVLPYTILEGTYRITGAVAADGFLLSAEPQGPQAADSHCGAFTIDHTGTPGITGTGTSSACWQGRQN